MGNERRERLRPADDYRLAAQPQQAVDMGQAGGVPRRPVGRPRKAVAPPPPIPPDPQAQAAQAAHPRPIPADGGDTRLAVSTPAVGQSARGVGQDQQTALASRQAANLPVEQLGGNIKSILSAAAPGSAAIVFEAINNLKRIAHATEQAEMYSEAMTANSLMGRLAAKTIEMTVGKQLNINATVSSQKDIVPWHKLPQDVRDRFTEALAKLPDEEVIDVTPTQPEPNWVPQSADEYKGGTFDEPTDRST